MFTNIFLVDQCLRMEKDKRNCPISFLSKAKQMDCCSSKKEDYTMLLSHFLANQIAGKPVCKSCHTWLTVQWFGSSTCIVKWLSSWGIGVVCLCFHAQNPPQKKPGLYLLLDGKGSLKGHELPPPPEKLLANKLKWCLSYDKIVFQYKWWALLWRRNVSLPNWVWYRKNFRQLHVHWFFYCHRLQFPAPTKIPNKTLG